MKLMRGDYAITKDQQRPGSLLHYHLPGDREIVVYPLLWGNARLATGSITSDSWDRAYDFGSADAAIEAAIRWIDTTQPPPGPWIREHGEKYKSDGETVNPWTNVRDRGGFR